jgi:hypothetical protein
MMVSSARLRMDVFPDHPLQIDGTLVSIWSAFLLQATCRTTSRPGRHSSTIFALIIPQHALTIHVMGAYSLRRKVFVLMKSYTNNVISRWKYILCLAQITMIQMKNLHEINEEVVKLDGIGNVK